MEIECYTPKDVMQILKISKSEVYKIFNSPGFPCFKLSERKTRIVKSDFEKWLNSKKDVV